MRRRGAGRRKPTPKRPNKHDVTGGRRSASRWPRSPGRMGSRARSAEAVHRQRRQPSPPSQPDRRRQAAGAQAGPRAAARPRSPASRGSPTATPPRRCAAHWSRSTAMPCRRSRRANIITPTWSGCRASTATGAPARHGRGDREFRRRRPARGREARRQALADPVPPGSPTSTATASSSIPISSPSAAAAPAFARSLRIVVAATPPSPIAWLIWSSPMTTSPAA